MRPSCGLVGPKSNDSCPSKRHTEDKHTRGGDGRVKSKAEARERLGPPEAGKGRKDSPTPTPEPLEGVRPHLDFGFPETTNE